MGESAPEQKPADLASLSPEEIVRRKRAENGLKGRKRAEIRAAAEARRKRVADLMLLCYSRGEIAEQLGVDVKTAAGDMDHVRKQWHDEFSATYQQQVELELRKLDKEERMLLSLVGRAQQQAKRDDGSPLTGLLLVEDARQSAAAAALVYDRVLKLRERRAKLLGLDRPAQVQAQVVSTVRLDSAAEARTALGDPRAVELLMELQDRLTGKVVDAAVVGEAELRALPTDLVAEAIPPAGKACGAVFDVGGISDLCTRAPGHPPGHWAVPQQPAEEAPPSIESSDLEV